MNTRILRSGKGFGLAEILELGTEDGSFVFWSH